MRRLPVWGVAAMLAATALLARVATPMAASAAPRLESLPMTLAQWSGRQAPPLDPDVERTLGTDRYLHRFYRGAAGTIEIDVAYYGQPRVGANMHSPLNCLPGSGWTMSEPAAREVRTATGRWTVREIDVRRGKAEFAMIYWFQSRLRVTGDEVAVRLHLLGNVLRRVPGDAAMVRLMMPARGTAARQRELLAAFAAEVIPPLHSALQ